MAQTLEAMRRRKESASDLYSVVRVMKALAAANIRQCEKAVESLHDYARTVEDGLQIAVRHRAGMLGNDPVPGKRWCVVVFGSDQGMCGSFNEQITQYALEEFRTLTRSPEDLTLLAVGLRIVGRLEDAGYPIAEDLMVPSTIDNITPRVNDLLLKIEQLRFQKGINQFLLIHHRPAGSSFQPDKRQLLPIDRKWLHDLSHKKWKSHSLPTYTLEWEQLFSSLVRQHLFVTLYRAFAESMASENSSRLASMQAAEKNIETHLNELTKEYHQRRQQGITEELLDIVAGFETLTQKPRAKTP
ncbi:F0F1 ATP synthase subunit gamma [Schlesneria sp.]|uniref:F0F1 ATP synthase subunit gamma n=1 Tax=Schlesneria sp. TaxID=2762018 RepID=UPI002F1E89F5